MQQYHNVSALISLEHKFSMLRGMDKIESTSLSHGIIRCMVMTHFSLSVYEVLSYKTNEQSRAETTTDPFKALIELMANNENSPNI